MTITNAEFELGSALRTVRREGAGSLTVYPCPAAGGILFVGVEPAR